MNYIDVFQLAKSKQYVPYLDELYDSDSLIFIELCLIQKWLRDNHNLAVLVSIPFDVFYRYSIDGINGNGYYTDSTYKETVDFNTYEAALLNGIAEALKTFG